MSAAWYEFETAKRILEEFSFFAVVGCSSDPARPSFRVTCFLMSNGYEVAPVNPNEAEVFGQRVYPDLDTVAAERPLEVIDIFRRTEEAGAHVDEAIELGAKAIWMQLDVIDEAAAARAETAGLTVVMNRCPAIDHPRLGLDSKERDGEET